MRKCRLRELPIILALLHSITASTGSGGHHDDNPNDRPSESMTAIHKNVTTESLATTRQREKETSMYNRLRGYNTAHMQQHFERIIDKEALESLDGADPSEDEFIFHPPGHEANYREYPFFAHWSHAMCGATVIHDDILLTAGHCGRKATEPHWRKSVRLLSKYREGDGITRAIAHLEPHPNFHQPTQIYDFQLVKIESSMLVDKEGSATGVQIVRLNEDGNNPASGDEVQAVGFGTVVPDGHTGNSQVLMDVTLQAFPNNHCAHQYGGDKIKGDVMVCVGHPDGTRDTCQGDSGGPMLDTRNVQIGVISWGEGCAEADHAGLASRVSAVTDWITQQICRLSAMPPPTCAERNFTTTSYDNRLPSGGDDDKGEFNMRITVQHDDAPQETSWSLTHVDSSTLLYYQPFKSVPAPFVDVSHVFHDLVAGTYIFAISDKGEDGGASVAITNHATNTVLWQHDAEFDEVLGVTFKLDSNGTLLSLSETEEWVNPSKAISHANAPDNEGMDASSSTPGNNEKVEG